MDLKLFAIFKLGKYKSNSTDFMLLNALHFFILLYFKTIKTIFFEKYILQINNNNLKD